MSLARTFFLNRVGCVSLLYVIIPFLSSLLLSPCLYTLSSLSFFHFHLPSFTPISLPTHLSCLPSLSSFLQSFLLPSSATPHPPPLSHPPHDATNPNEMQRKARLKEMKHFLTIDEGETTARARQIFPSFELTSSRHLRRNA